MTIQYAAPYAVLDYLKDIASVTILSPADRLFAPELPESQAQFMPRSAVVLSSASGPGELGDLPLDRQRVDVRSYAASPWAASQLALAVHLALKALRRRVVSVGMPGGAQVKALIHSAQSSGGFVDLREPSTRWPLTLRSYLVLLDERAVP